MIRIPRLSRSLLVAVVLVASIFAISNVDWGQADASAHQAVCRGPNQIVDLQDRAEILDLIDRYGPYYDYHEGEAWA